MIPVASGSEYSLFPYNSGKPVKKNVYDISAFSLSESLHSQTAKKSGGPCTIWILTPTSFNEHCHSIVTLLLRKLNSTFFNLQPMKNTA